MDKSWESHESSRVTQRTQEGEKPILINSREMLVKARKRFDVSMDPTDLT